MKRWLSLLACLVVLNAFADERKYAVMSLIGDGLLIVHRDNATGSNLDRNNRNFVPFKNPALDNTTLLAIDNEMRRRDPEVKPILLGGRDPAILALQARGLDEGSGIALLLPMVAPMAAKAGATHLILASKYRDEARIKMADGSAGAGRIDGLGFYLDRNVRIENKDTGAATQGYIAPFGYFSLSLIDLASGKVLAREVVREAFAIANQQAAVPWDAITPQEKAQMIEDLIRREVWRAVPLLFAKP